MTYDLLSEASLNELASAGRPPCLSLYQPTHRSGPARQQDPIRFRNLVKKLEASLRTRYSALETQVALEPFMALAHDAAFWSEARDGLAVLSGPGQFRVFRLQRPVAEFAVVADSYHTKPLRRCLQAIDRYQVLGLGLERSALFEGGRDALDEIDMAPEVPRNITEVIDDEMTEPRSAVTAHGGVSRATTPMHHGHGGKKDAAAIDAERFFRAVDRAVLEHHSRPTGLPLILAALPEHHELFRRVSHNPFLVAVGLATNPEDLPIDELRKRAWNVVSPGVQARLDDLCEEFEHARSKGLGQDDLAEVAEAASVGRVATLLVEADREIAGRLDAATGRVAFAELTNPEVDDLLDDLGDLVQRMGGQVVVLPTRHMPGRTGLAATYRY